MNANFFKRLFGSNTSAATTASHRTHAHYRRPGFEELTQRVAPATGLVSGVVHVTADAAANALDDARNYVDQIRVDSNAIAHMNGEAGLAHAGITATGADHGADSAAANAAANAADGAVMAASGYGAQGSGALNARADYSNVQGAGDAHVTTDISNAQGGVDLNLSGVNDSAQGSGDVNASAVGYTAQASGNANASANDYNAQGSGNASASADYGNVNGSGAASGNAGAAQSSASSDFYSDLNNNT